MENLAINECGRVLLWRDQNDVPIFFEDQILGGHRHGGSFTCAPQSGNTPEGMSWKLPKHGVVRDLTRVNDYDHLLMRLCPPKNDDYHLRFYFLATEEFPWMYHVDLSVGYEPGLQQLTQAVVITRMPGCPNREPMPVSLGFHPYLAVYGNYRIRSGNSSFGKRDIPLKIKAREKSVRLHNGGRTITVSMGGGYLDEWVLWSDATERYVCIEPVGGFLKPIHLEPGIGVSGVCVIESRSD